MTATIRKVGNILIIGLFCVVLIEGQEPYNPFSNPINQDNYDLRSSKDKYSFRIDFPDGGSRTETVQLFTDENGREVPKIEGVLKLIYQDAPFVVTVMYQADDKGYRAKYVYGSEAATLPIAAYASANLLKSAAG